MAAPCFALRIFANFEIQQIPKDLILGILPNVALFAG